MIAKETVINISVDFFDVDGDSLTASIIQSTQFGKLVPNLDGTYSYTPNEGFIGVDSFTFEVCDPFGACDTAVITITVNPNQPPVVENDFIFSPQVSTVTIDVLANDFDPENEPLEIIFIEELQDGIVTINPDNSLLFSPNPNIAPNPVIVFNYIVSDPEGATSTGTVTIEFGNSPPQSIDDTFVIPFGTTSFELHILENDFDLDGDRIFIVDFQEPMEGSLTLSDDSQYFILTGISEFSGEFNFPYVISDNQGGSSVSFVTIQIPFPGSSSFSIHDDSVTTILGEPVTIDVTENDVSEPFPLDLTTLSISHPPEHGLITIDDSDGFITYIPESDFTGIDTLIYQICNTNSECGQAEVSIIVFPGPLVSPSPIPLSPIGSTPTRTPAPENPGIIDVRPDIVEIPENTQVVTIFPLENDLGNLDPASFAISDPPEFGIAIIVNGIEVDYYPLPNFFGFDTMSYQICTYDKQCGTGFITIDVYPIGEDNESSSSSSSSSSDGESWCVGGIVLWAIAGIIGFAGIHVSNNGWHLLFLMQMIAVTGQLGIHFPKFYMDFVSCFGWSILDIPLPWNIDGFTVLINGLGGHGRVLLDFESWAEVVNINPEGLLWANFFWALIALIIVFIIMTIIFIIFVILQYFVIKSSLHDEEIEENGSTVKTIIIDTLEHIIRGVIIFIYVVFFGLTLTAFIIIGFFFRNVSSTKLVAPFIVSIIIALLGIIWFIVMTVLYLFYFKKKTNGHVTRILGFCFLHYRSTMGWWNSVNIARFYLIACVVGFFLGWGAVQLSLLLVIFIVYALGLIIFRPYYQVIPTLIDLFVSFAIIIILVLLFVAWGLGGDSSAAGWVLRVVIWIFWITILLYFVFVVAYFGFSVCKWFKGRGNIEDKKTWDETFLLYGSAGIDLKRRQHLSRDLD
mmetsp:Transcript_3822/g.5634  ORF Transcript_3822/g.5634 Transcript_3822/m.5634 type:complete len:910 (+) Transcript_3822:542-3271(+)